MAHSPAFRPDPFQPEDTHASPPQKLDSSPTEFLSATLSHYVQVLSASGGEGISAELAVDLLLNDVLQRVCAATGATAAAIALSRDGEMICRAATGEAAPDLGVALDTTHGLSGECVRTGERQCCADTDYDARVDAVACQRLRVRSIVVLPVKKQQELIGIVEIFSPDANRFGEYEASILEDFAREIGDSLDRANGIQSAEPSLPAIAEPLHPEDVEALPSPPVLPQAEDKDDRGDAWTTILLVCVVLLAGLLGWVVGWSKWRRGATKTSAVAVRSVQESPIKPGEPSRSTADASADLPAKPPVLPAAPAGRPQAREGGLVVYQNGKVIFPPGVRSDKSKTPAAQNLESGQLRLSPEIAKQYVTERIEPQYPEAARSLGIQGSVVVEILVGDDGSVQKLTPLSGNPALIPAATEAIRQWRFHPFFHQGEPHEFRTTVAVIFRLEGKEPGRD